MNISLMQGPGNSGVRIKDEILHLVAHAAITKGTVYTLDLGTATAANAGVATHSADSVDGAEEGTIWVLAMEDLAIGATGRFMLQGYTDATNNGTDVVAEDRLSSTAGGTLLAAPVGDVIIGISPEAETSTSGKIWFCGYGLGTVHA